MEIIESIVTQGHGKLNASYFVVHETANPGATALNHVNYWRNNPDYAVHYVGDWTGDVYHCVPDDRMCWQVGSGNPYVIGIELCHAKSATEFKKVWDLGVEFSAYYLNKKGWGIDRLMSHDECRLKWGGTDHTDPNGYFKKYGRTWAEFKAEVKAKMEKGSQIPSTTPIKPSGLQATSLKDLSNEEVIKKVGSLFTEDQKKTGILASVSLAQFILESGYGKSELAQKANNCFGMKALLSGNSWSGSVWDGSIYRKETKEQNKDGSYITIWANFRKYANIEDSIADHSAYLSSAKNGDHLRYAGLKGCTDYKKAFQIIKDGDYATSKDYVKNLCSVVEKWDLTKYDVKGSVTPEPTQKPTKIMPYITYAVKTAKTILPEAKNGGIVGDGDKIIGIRMGVTCGSIKYRVHCGGRWLPVVTGNNWDDFANGYAGDDYNAIDAIQIYYTSDTKRSDIYEAIYAVKPRGWASFLPEVHDTNWESGDGTKTAGIFGMPFGYLKIQLGKY